MEDRDVAHLRTACRSGLPDRRSWRLRCLPRGHILESIDGGSLSDLGALAEPIRIEDGHFTPPDRPGHGIAVDGGILAANTVDA